MLKIPEPIHDTTGGDEVKLCQQRWDQLCENIGKIILEEVGAKKYLEMFGTKVLEISCREVKSQYHEGLGDDLVGEFVFGDSFILAGYYDRRTENNFHDIIFFSRSERDIRELAKAHR